MKWSVNGEWGIAPLTLGMWQEMHPLLGLTGQVREFGSDSARSFAGGLIAAGVARQALRLVVRRRGRRIAVRVVAGHAIELVVAFGITAAPGQRRALEANRRGIVRRDGLAARAVALGADPHHPRAGGQARAGDRQVRELGGGGQQVVAPRAVALLAADGGVGRLGPRRPEERLGDW